MKLSDIKENDFLTEEQWQKLHDEIIEHNYQVTFRPNHTLQRTTVTVTPTYYVESGIVETVVYKNLQIRKEPYILKNSTVTFYIPY